MMGKKFFVCLFAAWAALLPAADDSLGRVRDNGIIEVKTDFYSLSFFPGHQFPFQFRLPDGAEVAEPVWLDRLTDADKKQYFLRFDRYAEREILRNDAETFRLAVTGSYCLSEEAGAPGRPQAVYTYECRRDSPEIRVTARISGLEDHDWREVYFLQPAWRGNPWPFLTGPDGRRQAFQADPSAEPVMYREKDYLGVSDGKAEFGLKTATPAAWDNSRGRYFSYLRGGWRTNKEQFPAEFAASIVLRPAAAAPAAPDAGWPASVSAAIGDLGIRLERRSNWTLYRVDFAGDRLGIDTYGAHYGNVFSFPGYGFVGSGHTENENEKLLAIRLEIDGKTVERPAADYRANRLKLVKKSLVRDLEVDHIIEIEAGTIRESTTVTARKEQPLDFAYFAMYPWSTGFTQLVSVDPPAGPVPFTGSRKMLLNQPARATAIYNEKLRKGVVMIVDAETGLGRRTEMFWDYPQRYCKHYSKALVNRTLKPGDRCAFAFAVIPYSASPEEWREKAAELCRAAD